MCGRYSLVCDAEHLQAYYDLVSAGVFAAPRFNIAPAQAVPAVVLVDGERHLELFRWGFIPAWAKDKRRGRSAINARAESIEARPTFRNAFRHRRCIIPADGFYEWQGSAGHRRAWRIEPAERREFFSFAGLWETWEGDGEVIHSCTIIVGPANALLEPIHDRMPIILPRDALAPWLDPHTPTGVLHGLLQPYPAAAMRAYRIGNHVNNPRHDDPQCLLPARSHQ